MNESKKILLRSLGYDKEVDLVEEGKCPFCAKEINPETEFRDTRSYREFELSGMCQDCQDETFGKNVGIGYGN